MVPFGVMPSEDELRINDFIRTTLSQNANSSGHRCNGLAESKTFCIATPPIMGGDDDNVSVDSGISLPSVGTGENSAIADRAACPVEDGNSIDYHVMTQNSVEEQFCSQQTFDEDAIEESINTLLSSLAISNVDFKSDAAVRAADVSEEEPFGVDIAIDLDGIGENLVSDIDAAVLAIPPFPVLEENANMSNLGIIAEVDDIDHNSGFVEDDAMPNKSYGRAGSGCFSVVLQKRPLMTALGVDVERLRTGVLLI